jgi:hypothetical protein
VSSHVVLTDIRSDSEIAEDSEHSQPLADHENSPPNAGDDGIPVKEHDTVLGVSSSTEENPASTSKATDNRSTQV